MANSRPPGANANLRLIIVRTCNDNPHLLHNTKPTASSTWYLMEISIAEDSEKPGQHGNKPNSEPTASRDILQVINVTDTVIDSSMPTFLSNLTLSMSPKTAFEQADNMIIQAAKLRSDAEKLEACVTEKLAARLAGFEDEAAQLDADAAQLFKAAQDDRGFIQDEFDCVMKTYGSSLPDYTINDTAARKLDQLILAVEEGTATLDDIEQISEKLRKFHNQQDRSDPLETIANAATTTSQEPAIDTEKIHDDPKTAMVPVSNDLVSTTPLKYDDKSMHNTSEFGNGKDDENNERALSSATILARDFSSPSEPQSVDKEASYKSDCGGKRKRSMSEIDEQVKRAKVDDLASGKYDSTKRKSVVQDVGTLLVSNSSTNLTGATVCTLVDAIEKDEAFTADYIKFDDIFATFENDEDSDRAVEDVDDSVHAVEEVKNSDQTVETPASLGPSLSRLFGPASRDEANGRGQAAAQSRMREDIEQEKQGETKSLGKRVRETKKSRERKRTRKEKRQLEAAGQCAALSGGKEDSKVEKKSKRKKSRGKK